MELPDWYDFWRLSTPDHYDKFTCESCDDEFDNDNMSDEIDGHCKDCAEKIKEEEE